LSDVIILDEFGNLNLLLSDFLALLGVLFVIFLAYDAAEMYRFANTKENVVMVSTLETGISQDD
jgi:hypothetical protein